MTKVMTKYQLEHYEKKIDRHFRPLIDSQELLIKQYKTEATNNVVKKLAKKMGADKILQQMKDAEETMKAAQASAKTFFDKVSKKDKKDLNYSFERDSERLSVSDCEDQLRTWAQDLVDLELQQRPEGKQLKDLRDLRQKAMDTVFESGTPDQLQLALDKVVKHIGITWAVDTSKIKAIAHN
tara:strand:+ start:224 stop:769 length:546 start_codon:yes stop_codon:yes gene_type:complete